MRREKKKYRRGWRTLNFLQRKKPFPGGQKEKGEGEREDCLTLGRDAHETPIKGAAKYREHSHAWEKKGGWKAVLQKIPPGRGGRGGKYKGEPKKTQTKEAA